MAVTILASTFVACEKDEDDPIIETRIVEKDPTRYAATIHFNEVANDIEVELNSPNKPYINAKGQAFNITRLRYLVSDITFHKADGNSFTIDEYHLVDISQAETQTFTPETKVPAGEYTSVSFTFGFDEEDNQSSIYPDLNIEKNFELFNKIILITGFGRIGKKLIKKCLGFDMKVIVFDPYVDDEIITSFGGAKMTTLEEGLQKADILSLSLPLNSETKNFITLKEMKIMKKSSIIINAARGGVVNEEDLNTALNNNIIAFAGIDVFEKEPPATTNPLITNKKVVLSPHAATFTKEGLEGMAIETAQNIIDFFENKIENVKIIKL